MLWSQNADQVLSGFRVHFLNKTRARLAEIWGCRCFLVIICVLLVSNDNFWIWFHCLYWLNSFNQFQRGERQSWPADSGRPHRWQPTGSPVPEILQARILKWVAISFSNAWKWKVKVKSLSRVWPSATTWTAAFRAPPPWDFPDKSTGVGCHCLLRIPQRRTIIF